MFLVNELWKTIDGFDGRYKVSTRGKIIDTKTGFEKQQYIKYGYAVVSLDSKSYKVHRLVAKAFLINPNNYDEVNHIDEDKLNNDVNNLEWCTHEQNVNHGTRTERASLHNGTKIVCLDLNGEFIKEYPSIISTEKDGFNAISVGQCVQGKQKTTGNCIWMKKSEYDLIKDKSKIKNLAKKKKCGRKTNPIYQISKDGIIIREYETVTKAAECGIGCRETIFKVVNHNKSYKTAGGFIWLKKKEYQQMSVDDFVSLVNNARNKGDELNKWDIEKIIKDKEKHCTKLSK